MRTIIICALIIIASCQKENFHEASNYSGDYSLEYIKVSDFEYMLPGDIETKAGIRVKKNGTIKTYVDNKLHSKYSMKELVKKNDEEQVYNYQRTLQDGITVTFYDGNRVKLSAFPYEGEENVFRKN